jgi:arylsulfatase A-like enzyme
LTGTREDRAARWGRPVLLLAALLAAAAVLLLVRGGAGAPPSVLLVTVDTMRADAYGEDTPALAELAARGRRFTAARTPVPLTLPGHATAMTGLLPAAHGLRDNTAAPLAPAAERGFPLLAEELAAAGYATAAFVASDVLDRRYGLDSGFSEYRSPPPPAPGQPRFGALTAEEQVARVLRWLDARPKDRPFFVWLHLWEPHDPYEPWAGDARRAGTAETDPPAELYRGEVRRADAALEAVLARVDPERTVVVVTSDHGESLGEHGEATHGHLCHGATMRVPLVLAGPGVPAGTEARPCSLEDVAPTLRRLCGLAPRPGDGRDLLDLPPRRVLVGESLYANRLYGWAQVTSAADGSHSLVDAGPRVELFDLAADPGETAPLPLEHPAYEELDRAIVAYRGRHPAPPGEVLAPEGTPYGSLRMPRDRFLPPAENAALPDVRDHLPELPKLYALRAAIAARDGAQVRLLVPAVADWAARDSRNPAPCLEVGRAKLFVLGDAPGALAALEEARARGYRSPDLDRLVEEARRGR